MSLAMVATGESHTCGVASSGAVFCWGLGSSGQLGIVPPVGLAYYSPMPVAGADRFITVSAGERHSCGVTSVGTYCWGFNDHGQLGDETLSEHDQMTPVHKP